jgi:hypothetical protein
MPSLVWLQNDHNKLPLAMQTNMHQQLQDVYCQTITHVSWPSNTNQHVCYNLHQHPRKSNPLCLVIIILETLSSSDIPNNIGHIQLFAFQRP